MPFPEGAPIPQLSSGNENCYMSNQVVKFILHPGSISAKDRISTPKHPNPRWVGGRGYQTHTAQKGFGTVGELEWFFKGTVDVSSRLSSSSSSPYSSSWIKVSGTASDFDLCIPLLSPCTFGVGLNFGGGEGGDMRLGGGGGIPSGAGLTNLFGSWSTKLSLAPTCDVSSRGIGNSDPCIFFWESIYQIPQVSRNMVS